jgi:PilZ domain
MYPEGMPDNTRSVKRRSERKRVQMIVTLVIEGDDAEYLADTVDLSPYGLCLQSNTALAPGQSVGLVLANEPASVIKSRVVWVGKADSPQGGQAGFEFLDVLTGPMC